MEDILQQYTNTSTRKVVKSVMKKALKHFETSDPEQLLRNDGDDLIAYCTKPNVLFSIVGYLKKLNPDIQIPKQVMEHGTMLNKTKKEETFQKKKQQGENPLLCMNKIQQHYFDQLYRPIKKISKATGKPLKPKMPKQSSTRHQRLALYTILKCCPIRFSAIAEMEWNDDGENNFIDLENKKMIVRNSKTSGRGKKVVVRDIYLHEHCIETLQKYKNYMKSKYVFPLGDTHNTSHNIEQLYRRGVKAYMTSIGQEYQKGMCGIHHLRAKQASSEVKKVLKLQPGCTIDDVEKMFRGAFNRGHSLRTILQNYLLEGDK